MTNDKKDFPTIITASTVDGASQKTASTVDGASQKKQQTNISKRRKPLLLDQLNEGNLIDKYLGSMTKKMKKAYDDCSVSVDTTESERRWTFSNPKYRTRKYHGNNQGKMPNQGLNQDGDDKDYNSQNQDNFWVNFEDQILDDVSFTFEGVTYDKNTCYMIEDNKGNDRIYAISHFLRESETALCIEIVKFQDTTLEKVQNTSKMYDLKVDGIDEYVLRAGSQKEIGFSEMTEVKEINQVPDWMYIERQQGSSCMFFGFVDVSKTPKRNGLRKSCIKAIDFFAGAGLMSSGFDAIGCNIVASVEKEGDAVQSYADIYNATAMDVSSDHWKITLKEKGRIAFHGTVESFLLKYRNNRTLQKALGLIDVVVLCPPCQGFSKQNVFKEGNVEGNNYESLRILEAAEIIRPKVLAYENVLGLWETGHIKKYLQKMVYGLMNKGYNVQVGRLYAADFGDPQFRPRLIIIASLSQIGLPVYPKPTHGYALFGNADVGGKLLSHVTVSDVLESEEDKYPENKEALKVDDIEEKARNPNKPAATVLASKSAIHYSKNRFYSLTENAILMGQDEAFVSKLVGNKASKQRQVGNGVPKQLASAIGRAVHEVLKYNWKAVDNLDTESESKSDLDPTDREISVKKEKAISYGYDFIFEDTDGPNTN